MERVKESKKSKIILIILILLTMLSSYLPSIVLADNEEDEYIKYKADLLVSEDVYSGKNIGLSYNLKFAGIQTGFQDVVLTVKDEDYSSPAAKVTANINENNLNSDTSVANRGRYATVNFGSVRTGTDFTGVVIINYAKDASYQDYDKEITAVLSAKYNHPQKGLIDYVQEIKIKKTIHTAPDIVPFEAFADVNFDSKANTYANYLETKSYNDFEVRGLTQIYPIQLKTQNETYSKIVITTSRTTPEETINVNTLNTEENFQVDVSAFTKHGYTSNIIRKSDGTTDIELTAGTQLTEYNNEGFRNMYSTEYDSKVPAVLNLQITYNIVEGGMTHTENVGSTTITTKVKSYIEGFHQSVASTGVTYTKGTYNQSRGFENAVNIWSHVTGSEGYDYDLWYDGQEKSDTVLLNEVKDGTIQMTTISSVDADVNGDDNIDLANESRNRLYVTNYNNDNINVKADRKTKVSYMENGDEKDVYIDDINMKVSKIKVNIEEELESVSFYKKGDVVGTQEPFFVATKDNTVFEPAEGQVINEYFAVMGNFLSDTGCLAVLNGKLQYNGYSTVVVWNTTWDIAVNDLNEKLTEDQLKNLKSISRFQGGKYELFKTELSPVCRDIGTVFVKSMEDKKWSYMEMDIGNYNVKCQAGITERKTITFSMYKNNNVIKDSSIVVKNVNPTFYLKLSDDFIYSDFKVTITRNAKIYVDSYYVSNGFLVINCKGTYDTSVDDSRVDIKATFTRKVKDLVPSTTKYVEAYMITDNHNYINDSINKENLSKDNITPTKIFYTSRNYDIESSTKVLAVSKVARGMFVCTPDSSDDVVSYGEKECPVPLSILRVAKFMHQFESTNKKLNNINMVCKLPVSGNKSVDIGNGNYKLVEDGIVGLTNLENIKIYEVANGKQRELNATEYTIGYSTDINAGLDSDFTSYVEGEIDKTQIKALQIKINQLARNAKISVQYEMTMPEDGNGLVGAQMAGRYTAELEETATVLDSEAAYVTAADDTSTIEVQKVFQGYDVGTSPEGISLSGIEFKIKDSEGNYLKDNSNNDIVAATDTTGIARFPGINLGEYTIEEITDIPGYTMDSKEIYVAVGIGSTVKVEALNKRIVGTLTIQKEWEDTNEQKVQVTFRVKGTGVDNTSYSVPVKTDNNGIATIDGIPYGEYEIEETVGQSGWKAEKVNVLMDQPEKTAIVTNTLAHGTLEINKTVPAGETVEGLKFEIAGLGMVNYTNKSGVEVNTNINTTITIGSDYSAIPNIDVTISEDGLNATITMSNLPLGSYTIREVEIPTIPGKDIEKFVAVTAISELYYDGQTQKINILNRRKQGYLEIKKEGYLQKGEEQLEIGDLSEFKVQIQGTSEYGTVVDKIVSLDIDGYAKIALEIGEYTVKEVPVDGYDSYYKTNDAWINSEVGTTVQIKYDEVSKKSETTTQELKNVHTGVGYVKVVKTLEGITDPSIVKNAGIKFKVVGKDIAGGQVEELIEINQIDLENDIAYGLSGPISSGGTYQLEEVENTVPDYFEGIDPIQVDVKTSNTLENPLVMDVENKRTKGNLEIVTQTNPKGGPLDGITYRVTEVKINNDGTYTKIGESINKNGETSENAIIIGENGGVNASRAQLTNIYSGNYLVEQVNVPAGWQKDVNQIVEVPGYGTGRAIFEITQKREFLSTTVEISKEIVNEDDELASIDDFVNAKLNESVSFEVKLTNVDTKQEYYTFINGAKKGIINGLLPGTYEVEEINKLKYITEKYYKLTEGIAPVEIEKNSNEKYEIVIENETSKVELKIRNKINDKFGFGGISQLDNYSKYDAEQEEIIGTTKSIVYVVDENDNALPGAKFKIVDSQGNDVVLGNSTSELTTVNRKIVITGLEKGIYKLVCVSVPDGYLKSEDKEFVVYDDAVRISRVEIQRNIPRGSLMLATTYETIDGETKYTSRSNYKIVNSATGELMKFTKTLTGDYVKSELPDAEEQISLKSGTVNVIGIEVGTYEVGLTGVTLGYGMQNSFPEIVKITEGMQQSVNVEVIKNGIKQISAGYYNTMYLDVNGDLWIFGANYNGEYGNSYTGINIGNNIPYRIKFPEGVKIDKFSQGEYHVIAIDTQGKVWIWGAHEYYNNTPICVTELEDNPFKNAYDNGTRFVDVSAVNEYKNLLLDNQGKIWIWDGNGGIGNGENGIKLAIPKCLSDEENTELNTAYKNNIKICELEYNRKNSSGNLYFIDSLKRLWLYNNYGGTYKCVCISELDDQLSKIKAKSVSNGYIVDKDGTLWYLIFSYNSSSNKFENFNVTKIDNSVFNGKKVQTCKVGYNTVVLDEIGKMWLYNNNNWECISERIDTILVDIAPSVYNHYIALGSDGKLYGGIRNYRDAYYGALGKDYPGVDKLLFKVNIDYTQNLDYNINFQKMFGYCAIDNHGKLWLLNGSQTEYITGSYYDSTPSIVQNLADEEFVQLSNQLSGGYSYIGVTKDGNVYEFSYSSYLGVEGYGAKDITFKFNLEDGVKIISVQSRENGSAAAVDSLGRVWTWGNNTCGQLGNGTLDSSNENPICISDNINEKLYNVKIKDVQVCNNTIFALDSNGKIWAWGYTSGNYIGIEEYQKILNGISNNQTTPICLSEIEDSVYYKAYNKGIKFVEIYGAGNGSGLCLLDNYGKLWGVNINTKNVNPSDILQCISDVKTFELNANYQLIENYKIQKVKIWSGQIFVQDNQGDSWLFSSSSTTKLSVKNIKDASYYGYIDEYGQLFRWGDTEPLMTSEVPNKLYNVKIKDIISSYDPLSNRYYDCVEVDTTKGEIYNITGSSFDFLMYGDNYIEKYLGIKLNKSIKNCVGSVDKSVCVALDEKGKVWTWGIVNKNLAPNTDYTIPQCISDIDNSNLYNAYKNDSNFKIVDIVENTSKESREKSNIILLDNYGKIWFYGSYSPTNGNAENLYEFICISDIEGTTLKNKYTESDEYKIISIGTLTTDVFYVIDSNNDTWIWGDNRYGQLGTGNKNSITIPYCLSAAIGTKIKKIVMNDKTAFIIDESGSVWSCGFAYYNYILGNGLTQKLVPSKINNAITNIDNVIIGSNYVIAYGENNSWIWGDKWVNRMMTENPSAEYSTQQFQLSTEFTIKKVVGNSSKMFIIDNQGKVWLLGEIYEKKDGHTNYYYEKPVCISDDETSVLNGVNIVDSIDIGPYKGVLIDSEGNYYRDISGDSYVNDCLIKSANNLKGELEGKTIVKRTENLFIDSDGKLYGNNGYDGLENIVAKVPTCLTDKKISRDAYVNSKNVLINNPIINKLNNVKIKQIVNNQIVLDNNNNYWYYPENNEVINLTQTAKQTVGALYGKEIIEKYNNNYVVTSDNKIYYIGGDIPVCLMENTEEIDVKEIYRWYDYYIVLDTNGKIWTCGNGVYGQLGNGSTDFIEKPVCLSDISGTEFGNSYKVDENFKIVSLHVSNSAFSSSVVALDNKGKIWTWGYNFSGQAGNGTTMYSMVPICISDIADTELKNAYNDSTFKIESIETLQGSCVALDNKGKIWTWGYNYYGLLGNGTSDNIKSPICISNLADTEIGQLGSEFKAVKAKFVGTYSSNLIVLGNNGKVYTCGSPNASLGCTTKRLNLVCVNNTMDGITDIECDNNGIIGYTSDGMWIYGYGGLKTAPLKCNIDIKEKTLTSMYIMLLDTDGKVWTLGHKGYIGYTVPSDVTYTQTFECLNDRTDSPLYQKEIQKIINWGNSETHAVSSDGTIYVLEYNKNVQECNIYDEAIQKIYGDMSIEHKIEFLENFSTLNNKYVNETRVNYRTGSVNGNNWEIYYSSDMTQIDSIVKVETRTEEYEPLISKLTEISEILDETHFKTLDDKIFKINDDGTFTCIKEYTPSTEKEEINTKVIDGVNIVAQTKNKALDDQGKLYVWDDTYNGGYNSYDVICTTDEEYIIKPIYSSGSGWTAIKQSY